jgi:ribonuclease P protein subunit RPR2
MRNTQRRISREIAGARISVLFSLCLDKATEDMETARKYVKLIRKISTHYKVRIPNSMKPHICKKCNTVMIPGKSAIVRIVSSNRYVAYRCSSCGWEFHRHY